MTFLKFASLAILVSATFGASSPAVCQQAENAWREVGGFRCLNLSPFTNDATFDLNRSGYWSSGSFGRDVWKRHGVPFWYPKGTGNLRVAGERWSPPTPTLVSSAQCGSAAHADRQQPGNGAIKNANDDDYATYWYAGEGRPSGELWIEFATAEPVLAVRFLGWATPIHAPKDYRVGLILADGSRREIASVEGETRMGQWISFDVEEVLAKGVYLDVTATVENQHGPVVYELQARGAAVRKSSRKTQLPSEIEIPLGGATAEELFVLGNVAMGLNATWDTDTPVGEYVLSYETGEQEVIPLILGKNLADARYGHFADEAELAFAFGDNRPPEFGEEEEATGLHYHLDELLPVAPRKQLMMFTHQLARPGRPLKSIILRVTDADTALYMAALTLRRSGPRMNALFLDGKRIAPYPHDTPKAAPSPLDALADADRTLCLNGPWQYQTDPGNRGVTERFFAAEHDASSWQSMPVPSQWYAQGLDYHGVVWFRRQFELPATLEGSVLQMCFGGVDYDARVWVNGQYVGRHVGAYSSFKLDVTDAVHPAAVNTVVVRVDSPIDPGFPDQKTLIKGNAMDDIAMPYGEEGCMGGIYRPVSLRGRGRVGLEDVWTASTVSRDLTHADVSVRFALHSKQPREEELTIHCRLKQPDGTVTHTARTRLPALAEGKTPVELVIAIDDPRLWYPWEQGQPYLYLMEIEVRRQGQLLDRRVSRVGVRQVDFDLDRRCLYVNHHRIFLKGMLNDDLHWMSLMDRTGYRQRIQLQKDANLNLIRMVTHQSSPEMYDLANEMGMLIWQEIPLQWSYSNSPAVREDMVDVVRETMTQCRAHACVIGYSAWNEGGQGEFSDRLVSLMESLDHTRPISKSCGGGGWDIHIYPNLAGNLSRMTPLWSGVEVGFVSEVGAYGLSSLDEMHAMLGRELFPFDSAHYYWDTFNSYRFHDGPVFLDAPPAADWSTERIREYMLQKQPASERWLVQFMKYMYENFRGLRFEPTTAAIHCRFDDPLPTSFLGVVNFSGRPRKAYYAVQQACQQVLPILFFDYAGAEDVRVVNEYWFRSWKDCTLEYTLKTRDGRTVEHLQRNFDLPADATVKVLSRQEVGDVWRLPGFFADLRVTAADGTVLSENRYDLTESEIRDFVTTVYPPPPRKPLDAILLTTADSAAAEGTEAADVRLNAEDSYSEKLLELGGGGKACALRYEFSIPRSAEYLIRVACDSGETLKSFELTIDGRNVRREEYPFIDVAQGITRVPYSSRALSWRPGWRIVLPQGPHSLVLGRTQRQSVPPLVFDALCLQPSRRDPPAEAVE